MVTRRDYYCDLCRDRVYEWGEDQVINGKPGVGIRFAARERIEKQPVNQVEHHICMDCLGNIKRMLLADFAGVDFSK